MAIGTARTPSEIDKEGMRILKGELGRQGWAYEDVQHGSGYDFRARAPHRGWKQIEVKSGKGDGWLNIDIRKTLDFHWNNRSEKQQPFIGGLGAHPTVKVTFDLKAPTFDEVFIVTRVSTPKPKTYHCAREKILRLPGTTLSYKGFLVFELGTQARRERHRCPHR